MRFCSCRDGFCRRRIQIAKRGYKRGHWPRPETRTLHIGEFDPRLVLHTEIKPRKGKGRRYKKFGKPFYASIFSGRQDRVAQALKGATGLGSGRTITKVFPCRVVGRNPERVLD